jgi:hypothetical protein
MRKSDIVPAAEILERAAEAFESDEIHWVQNSWGFIPVVERDKNMKPEACLIGGLAMAAGVWTNTVAGESVMTAGTNTLSFLDEDELRQFALARKAAADILKNRADGVKGRKHAVVIAVWNDREETTLGEVLDVLKLAAKDLRNQAPAT